MRIVVVAETFLPQMNGVVNSVIQMLDHFHRSGHEVLVIAPRAATDTDMTLELHGAAAILLPSVPLPSYPDVRVTLATAGQLEPLLRQFRPDVVHLAAPFVLGWQALRAADHLGIPTVAIYQTDIPGYAQRYGIAAFGPALSAHLGRIHRRANLTLAPSRSAVAELAELGVDRLELWARGVDSVRFAPTRRSADWRARMAPEGELVIGYVGRLAAEKQVEDLGAVADIAGTRLVIVGDGPSRPALEATLPGAQFLGFRGGVELAEIVASFDIFVHPGENETFCQTVQEALASGIPVVATGKGGPLDLVQSSRTGWLYRPGDLADFRERVLDLVGDDVKRSAFAFAARESVAHRSWAALGDELLAHYRTAIDGSTVGARTFAPAAWTRFVAVGDSLTEGLSDTSRQSEGEYRGWADRFAGLLAHASDRTKPLLYANLAVRSRCIDDVIRSQIPLAIELHADVVSVLVGANDLVRLGARPVALARELGTGISRLRASGIDVLVIAPFAPRRWYLRVLHGRIRLFNAVLRDEAVASGAMFLDFSDEAGCLEPRAWAEDRVHLSSHGHRLLSYAAATSVGLAGIRELGPLDIAMHDEEPGRDDSWIPTARWLWTHVRPWLGRRVRGQTAGDGLVAKRTVLAPVLPVDPTGSFTPAQ